VQGDQAPRARTQKVDLDSLRLVDGKRFDAQYGAERGMKGIALAAVIDSFAPDPSLDLAILHFANGMAIPVPFRDLAVMKRLDPFIARGMETHAGGPVKAGFFPDIRRKGATRIRGRSSSPATRSSSPCSGIRPWRRRPSRPFRRGATQTR
jgi:hypothetical protein